MKREPPGAPPDPITPGSAEAPVRGGGLLRRAERLFTRLDAWIEREVPPEMNPLTQTGAIANLMLVIATVTGVLLLLWYVPSVQRAHESVEAMMAQPFGGGLVRALHRYSSDACVFFVLLHALRMFFERRFTGARWLAWVTGVVATVLLWTVGWTGYWLVWDQAGQVVATETARFLDAIPIFIEPLARSFLTDASINSLLFLLVFFFHMLVPIALGVALWLHISRVSRSRFLTGRTMTVWSCLTLVLLSVFLPAGLHDKAAMATLPTDLVVDAWYLLPLWVTGHLGTGALWALTLLLLIGATAIPWLLSRGPQQPSAVEEARCNACSQCVTDCPYAAITMVARTDDRRHEGRALVDPALCVGCGICAGSCDSSAIGIPWLEQQRMRLQVDGWAREAAAGDGPGHLVFACAESAAEALRIDPETGGVEGLPGCRALAVPCAGWVHALSVERAVRKGFSRVTVVACPEGSCRYREGTRWTRERLAGEREPELRVDRVPEGAVRVIAHARGDHRGLRAALSGKALAGASRPLRWRRALVAVALAAGLAALVGLGSHVPLHLSGAPDGALVIVSFKHAASVAETCRTRTAEELEALPVHMRRAEVCERRRPPVRVQVEIDGQVRHADAIAPTGMWGDGFSLALIEIPVEAGPRTVAVRLAEGDEATPWRWEETRAVDLPSGTRLVILFDAADGFAWHTPPGARTWTP